MQGDVFSEHSVGKTNVKQNQNFPELCPGPHLGKLTALPSPLSWWGGLLPRTPALGPVSLAVTFCGLSHAFLFLDLGRSVL